MKVLIVDDEQDVRDSIRLLVDWDEFGITDILEAEDGASAMELIRNETPEIIFTDMRMPNVDGMELLQWIEAEAPASKRIVISGYDDYTYIRKAMKHGGLDYLLKPINRAELLDSLRSAVHAWNQAEAERRLDIQKNVEINQTKPVYWDKVLSSVVSQPGYYRTVEGELNAAFGWMGVRECRLAMLLTDPLPRIVLRKFGHHLDLLYFLMTNICNEIVGSAKNGYAFKHTDPNHGIVLLFTGNPASLDDKLRAMNDAFFRILGARFYFACSPPVSFPDRIHIGFGEVLQAARSVSFHVGTERMVHDSGSPAPAGKQVFLADYRDSIAVAVYSGDRRQIQASVAKWAEAVGRLGTVTWDQLKYWRYEFELLRNHLLQSRADAAGNPGGGQPAQGLFPIDENGRLMTEDLQREWTDLFGRIAEVLGESRQPEHNVIHAIKQFIDANYSRNLSLQDIASRFFISREYISRKFKLEFGENLSDYIERVRIEKAKILLANDKYAIGAVAELVGYQDGKYFSKIFGKLTGLSPREYRKITPQNDDKS